MRFGINTLTFTDTFNDDDLALFDHARELGFDVLEITPVDPDHFPAAQVRKRATELGMSVVVNYALPESANTISPDPAIRRRAVELSRKLIDLFTEAGAEIYGGANYCAWKYFTGKRRTEDEWRWGVDCYREIAEYAQAQSKLILSVETLNRFETYYLNTLADACRFVDEVGMPNVKVHLDTFHMLREEDDLGAAIRACGDRVAYFQACGSQRGIPGKDLVPWREVIEALHDINYEFCITLESFHPRKKFAPLLAIWRDFADSPEQFATEGREYLQALVREVYGPRG
jgi:D-psicose/D-tagatose/L-ribulose 3-epimerase